MTKAYSTDLRRLPRFSVGSKREPNRYLILVAHDPLWNTRDAPLVTYPGGKVLGQAWLESRGPWLAILHRDLTMGPEPHYSLQALAPTRRHFGQAPLRALHEAAQREAERIVRDWNEFGVKPTGDQVFYWSNWTGRRQP
ncbi:MAG: hypothetical protein LC623_05410 [Halobacteriales archaeon]|nr:hypothetical protein [Halobacteriales archaeon]